MNSRTFPAQDVTDSINYFTGLLSSGDGSRGETITTDDLHVYLGHNKSEISDHIFSLSLSHQSSQQGAGEVPPAALPEHGDAFVLDFSKFVELLVRFNLLAERSSLSLPLHSSMTKSWARRCTKSALAANDDAPAQSALCRSTSS